MKKFPFTIMYMRYRSKVYYETDSRRQICEEENFFQYFCRKFEMLLDLSIQ